MEHMVDHKKEGNKKMKQPNVRKLSLLLCLLLIFSTVLGGCGAANTLNIRALRWNFTANASAV